MAQAWWHSWCGTIGATAARRSTVPISFLYCVHAFNVNYAACIPKAFFLAKK